MQTASTPFPTPSTQNGYQPLSEAEIYAIKKQYLELLPPQQVIDICLTFESHAPLHVKSSVWPYDIRAAIATILAKKAQSSQTQAPSESGTPSKTSVPDANGVSDTTPPQTSSSQQQLTPAPSQAGQPASTSSASLPTTSQSQVSPAAPGPHYPHQSYYHPTYPHAPYYTTPHGTYGYPPPYPPYPQPSAMYAVNPASHHPPLFTNTPLSPPTSEPPPPHNSIDDLPSYEEMIVEALLDSGDPEGCAPKTLFNWMSTHYPLQMNFRPSASQALQKAYKRGRLEKGNNGKYRLNENWEGGATSKRTTRRPQTLAQTTLPGSQPSSSPFTQTPLVPHGNVHTRLPPPGQPPGYGGYPFGYSYPGAPGPTQPSAGRDGLTITSQKQAVDVIDHETGEGDAWEAAQNILKAINFGQLIQISNEEHKSGEPSAPANSLGQQAAVDRTDMPPSASDGAVLEGSTAVRPEGSGKSTVLDAEQRAALQAQLALLAAQLAELADVSEDELSQNLEVSQGTTTVPSGCTPQFLGEGSGPSGGDSEDDDDDESMVEVQVPTSLTA